METDRPEILLLVEPKPIQDVAGKDHEA